MNIGFDTIGNAILICYDHGRPVLVTDPWITGSADFGSWGFSHEIPKDQLEAILHTQYVWLSHGHPDHLQAESLDRLRG
jgi:L-ascorbate metabolism protein UlaG (beta-lactamase superfamily)